MVHRREAQQQIQPVLHDLAAALEPVPGEEAHHDDEAGQGGEPELERAAPERAQRVAPVGRVRGPGRGMDGIEQGDGAERDQQQHEAQQVHQDEQQAEAGERREGERRQRRAPPVPEPEHQQIERDAEAEIVQSHMDEHREDGRDEQQAEHRGLGIDPGHRVARRTGQQDGVQRQQDLLGDVQIDERRAEQEDVVDREVGLEGLVGDQILGQDLGARLAVARHHVGHAQMQRAVPGREVLEQPDRQDHQGEQQRKQQPLVPLQPLQRLGGHPSTAGGSSGPSCHPALPSHDSCWRCDVIRKDNIWREKIIPVASAANGLKVNAQVERVMVETQFKT